MIYTIVVKDLENKDNIVAYYDFDCVRSFDMNMTANVSATPVESSVTITDNISYEPTTYNIEAIVSSYGIFDSKNEIVYDGKGLRKVGNGTQEQVDVKTHLEARNNLLKLFFGRQIVTLVESDRKPFVYDSPTDAYKLQKMGNSLEVESCVITSMKVSYPDSADDALYISLTLQKVLLAKAQLLTLTADEMIPQLVPLIQTPTEVGSTTTEDKTDGTGSTNSAKTPTTKTGDAKTSDAKTSDVSKRTQDPEYQRAIANTNSQAAARNRAASLMALENREYTIVQRGAGNWEAVPVEGGTTADRKVIREY